MQIDFLLGHVGPVLSEQFDRTYPRIYKYLRYRGVDIDTANDLAATDFERALAKLSSYDPLKAAFDTWLFAPSRITSPSTTGRLDRGPVSSP